MKLILFKKSFVIALAVILASGVILGICCGVAAKTTLATAEKVIVIDAGHGGIDAGVRGKSTGVKESDINLSISKKLMGYFADAGFAVVLTRKNNGGLYGLSTSGFKMRDMKKRKEIIEQNKADMVISIHQNFCPSGAERRYFSTRRANAAKVLPTRFKAVRTICPNALRKTPRLREIIICSNARPILP